jgi:DNA-binding MarR family transcriptional regulator
MELYYNPDALSESRIKHTFVGRQWLLDELIAILRRQPEGAGVQHVLLVAPRGMGKTTLFLMLGFAVNESELQEKWQVVRYREESYNITDAAEFWLEGLRQLSMATADEGLRSRFEQAIAENRKSVDLEAAAVALLKDWVRAHGKRLLLLVENFDGILAQINSEQENSRLRNTLMNDGSVMLLGAATSFFEETRGYEKPLYNFFKVYNLEALNPEQMEDLLIKRAEVDGKEGFRVKLKQNAGQIRAIARFTGGNPRLILMLYAVIANAELTEVRTGLEKLLDEVTPYFKAKAELLPPQQRKILDQIARESARTMEGQSPTAIGKAIRMTPNQVSAQLKRMAEGGYVRSVPVRGRVAYYTLSEPLFALWYQMRFGRDARERMNWLVSFLRVWYDDAELGNETERLCQRLADMVSAGQRESTQELLEYGTFLVDAIRDPESRALGLAAFVEGSIKAGEVSQAYAFVDDQLKNELSGESRGALNLLRSPLRYVQGQYGPALDDLQKAMRLTPLYQSILSFRCFEARLLLRLQRMEEALDIANGALEIAQGPEAKVEVQRLRAEALFSLKRTEEWRAATCEIIELAPNDLDATFYLGLASLIGNNLQSGEEHFTKIARSEHATDHQRQVAFFLLFVISCVRTDYRAAVEHWRALSATLFTETAREATMMWLTALARNGHSKFLLETIQASPWKESLAPFLRALEYVESGDRDLIERLSPEVRTVVEDLVAGLQEKKAGTLVPAFDQNTTD